MPFTDSWVVDAKELHDLLLSAKPDGAAHDSTACAWCSPPALATEEPDRTGGGVLDVSITQEDIDKAVAAAVAPLQTELEALRKFKADVESTDAAKAAESAIADAKAEAGELQSKLDAEVIKANEAQSKYDDLVAWLASEAERAEQEAQVAALREERTQAVKDLKIFPETYVEENAQRYAEMTAEAFEASLADWQAVKASKSSTETEEEEETPVTTSFVATRDEDGVKTSSTMSELMRLRNKGVDVRRIRA